MPDSIRKLTKKYLTTDFVTMNLAQEETADDDDDDDEDSEESVVKVSGAADKTSRSLLGKQENYTTYHLTTNEEIKSVGFVFTILRKCFGDDFDAKGAVPQVAFTKDFKTAVFDLPSEHDEQLQSSWKDNSRTQMGPITELPELDESSMYDNKNASRGGSKPAYGGGGGGGNRNSGRSNACFNCQKEGHKSWECPEASGQRNGGNRSGGGGGGSGCFNCGKEGHRSFECPEPKKAGGRPGGGERSNACFNCGKDGHKSFECSEPKKAGGRPSGGGGGGGERSNACFNCGKDGHKSFECPEPKKGRPSFGGGGGGRGDRGGSRGGGPKRNFGGDYSNGHSAGETTNKKIKFDDDDD